MASSMRLGVVCITLVACGGKKDEADKAKDRGPDVPTRIAFSDCTSSPVPFVSGPRPLPPQADEGEATASADPAAPPSSGSAGAPGNAGSDFDGRTRVPTTSIGQPNAVGDLDKVVIRSHVRRHLQEIQYCYERRLLVKPQLDGMVVVQFFIGPSGRVMSAKATGIDPEVASCVADVIKGIEFPKPGRGGGVAVNYPFRFRIANGEPPAEAEPDDSGAGWATAAASGSASAPRPPAQPRPVAGPYHPGAHDPLRQVEPGLAACLRGATFGAMIVDLELDAKTGQVTKATPGTTDSGLAACIAAAAKTARLETPGPTLQRCGFAYGEMPRSAVPTVAITATEITFNGKVVDHPSNVLADSSSWKIAALFEALDAWQNQPPPQGTVPIRGPGLLEPLDATPMKIVNNALATAYAAAADLVLAAQRGPQWVPLRDGIVLPVAPVPAGSGGTWSGSASAQGGRPSAADERVKLSLLIAKDQIWVGLSRVNEFQHMPARDWAKLEQALTEHKASALFADRSDLEIAGEDVVVYGDIVKTIELAVKVGFLDWKVLPPFRVPTVRPP